ncbi:hypothetical protein ABZ351_37470, partial [Streptomyces microflavus]|uniref:hypothetical protein n=2 Tax=Actinomycetes TaxID=1760 RepID=UPI0033FD6456
MARPDEGKTEAERQLTLHVGLVCVVATAAAAVALYQLAHLHLTGGDLTRSIALAFMAALGVRINWRIRIRATVHAISWSETAIVLGLAVAPAPLVVLTTGTGVAIALLSMKPSPLKTAFGIAKSMLLAAGGGIALHTLGWSPQDTDLRHVIGMIGLAYLVAVVLDELLT